MANENFVDELKKVFGGSFVVTEKTALEIYSSDMCPRNLLENPEPCVAAVKPNSDEYERQISELVSLSVKYGQKIIVRGGGSGVCGAAVPKYPLNTVVVDATGLDKIYEINTLDGYVLTGPGIMGLRLERAINDYGFTLGHSPASLSISTPGGWIATRSSGQFSSRYGTIENLTLGIEVIFPDGIILWIKGSGLKSFFRMEGTTGIITKVQMKIFPQPKYREFYSFSFFGLKNALEMLKILFNQRAGLEKNGVFLAAARLYDFFDYKFVSKPGKTDEENREPRGGAGEYKLEKFLAKHPRLVNFFLRPFLNSIKLLIVLESDDREKLNEAGNGIKILAALNGGVAKNKKTAEVWYENRFKLNYEKLEKRFQSGLIIDTFDCCGDFNLLARTYNSVKKAVENLALAGAHFGMDKDRFYIYFTFAAAADGSAGLALYDEIWRRILGACRESEMMTTHHHGVGFLKAGPGNSLAPYAYGKEWYERIAVPSKKKLDPQNLLNPGNLV